MLLNVKSSGMSWNQSECHSVGAGIIEEGVVRGRATEDTQSRLEMPQEAETDRGRSTRESPLLPLSNFPLRPSIGQTYPEGKGAWEM